MKKILLIWLGLFFVFPKPASAHLFGQPPFFKVNGVYSDLYPVPTTSIPTFELPQDLPKSNYLVNQDISFELDEARLPAPPDIVAKTMFSWDFGDGKKGQGLKNVHRYTKIGAYLLKIFADDGTTPTPQLLESALISVLPDKNYQLPQAVIKVNGWQSKNPITDILKVPFDEKFQFDGSSSQAKSSKIVSYFWDFGDQQSSNDAKITHSYQTDLIQVFPVLRVVDANGFIGDSFVELENSTQNLGNVPQSLNKKSPSPVPTTLKKPNSSRANNQLEYVVIGLLVLFGIGLFMKYLKRRK